ncbi:MAG: hypothetical protein ACREHF_09480 [Rhizomicrobium sp.]
MRDYLSYWGSVLTEAWQLAWSVVIDRSLKALSRDFVILAVALYALAVEKLALEKMHALPQNDSLGTETLVWVGLVAAATMVIFAATFLFCALLVAPYRLSRMQHAGVANDAIGTPIVSPAQEKLLSVIAGHQRQFAAKKLIIDRKIGRLYFDEDRERGKGILIIAEMFGENAPDGERRLEELMYSIPTEYLRLLPEGRLGDPYVVAITDAGLRYVKNQNLDSTTKIALPPIVEIRFEKRKPYEVTETSHGQALSTVRVGIRNFTGSPLSNCQVYVDQALPAPPSPHVFFPIQLSGGGFTMRTDDPEHFVDIATQWGSQNRFRFNSPPSAWAEGLNYVDDAPAREIVIRVQAIELQRSASFRIWTDDTKTLHLESLGYI